MIFKFINRESRTIIGAAAIVGVLSFVSRMFGLVRDRILAGEFGAGDVLDAYYAAFKLPDLMFSLIVVGSLSASFIPLFIKHHHSGSKEKAWRLTNNTLHLLVTLMIFVSVVLILLADPIAQIIAPGFEAPKQILAAEYMRIMFLAQIFLAASVVFGSVLQGIKRFVLFSIAPILYNVGIIFGALVLVDYLGPIGLAWGVVLGAGLHLVVQLIGVMQAGFRYKWTVDYKDSDTREIFRLAGPRMLGVAVSQINVVIFTIIASTLAVGSVTVFQFAYNIQFFPVGIIGIAFAVAAFPSFSERLSIEDIKGFVKVFSATVRQVLFFLIPVMLVFLIVRAQIVRVVVGAGEFDWSATIQTADTLAFFAISFVPQALVFILARAFFALHDTITPLVAGLASALIGLISALWLTQYFGVVGLAMAFSIAAIINAALLWAPLRGRLKDLDDVHISKSLFKMIVSSLPAAVVMQNLKLPVAEIIHINTFFGVFIQGFIAGGTGLIVYILMSYVLQSEELKEVVAGIRRKVLQESEPQETISTQSPTAS